MILDDEDVAAFLAAVNALRCLDKRIDERKEQLQDMVKQLKKARLSTEGLLKGRRRLFLDWAADAAVSGKKSRREAAYNIRQLLY